MRVLAVSPVVPWPPDSGGRIRTAGLLAAAAGRVELELWCAVQPELDRAALARATAELERSIGPVRLFPRSPLPAAARAVRSRPEQWFHSAALDAALRSRDLERFETVHLDEPCLARSLARRPPGPGVVVHHHKLDRELHAATSRATTSRGLARALESVRLARLERLAARWSEHVVCCREDAERLARRHPHLRPSVVPNGFDPAPLGAPDRRGPRDPARLVFVGTLSYAPNVDGLVRFAREVWPRIRRLRPDARLDVVGREPIAAVRALAGDGIRVVGPVDDVRPVFARAAALVAPLSIGGGTRLKIIEALALGTPVVATRTAAEGLGLEDGVHLDLVGDLADREPERAQAFARRVAAVLVDPPAARERARRGRAYVTGRHTWTRIAPSLVEAWSRAARRVAHRVAHGVAHGAVPGPVGPRLARSEPEARADGAPWAPAHCATNR